MIISIEIVHFVILVFEILRIVAAPDQDIVFEQNKLILPNNIEELDKKILHFLFKDDEIIPGYTQQLWLNFVGSLKRKDPYFYRFLKRKLKVTTAEGLNKILMKFTRKEVVRFGPRLRVLLIPRQNETNNQWKETLRLWTMDYGYTGNQIDEVEIDEETDNPNGGHDSILTVQRSNLRQDGPVLPSGWEWRRDLNGRTLYYDHNNRIVTFQRPPMNTQSSQHDRLSGTAQRFATMFVDYQASNENIDPTGRFDVRNYGIRRTMSSEVDTEDLQDVVAETTEGNGGEITITLSDEHPAKFISRQTSRELGPLPDGWEEKIMPNGKCFFVNHNKAETTWEDPRFALSHYNAKCPEYSSKYRNKYRR